MAHCTIHAAFETNCVLCKIAARDERETSFKARMDDAAAAAAHQRKLERGEPEEEIIMDEVVEEIRLETEVAARSYKWHIIYVLYILTVVIAVWLVVK